MLKTFGERRHEEELMDLPSTSADEFRQALRDIQWVNRKLGGTRALLEAVEPMIAAAVRTRKQEPVSILDLGTGSADIPIALVEWGRAHNIRLQVTALDLHPVAIEASREMTRNYPEIQTIRGDALHTLFANGSFDIVTSSMFMHHLEQHQAIQLLLEMARLGRTGFVINDLERHPLAYWGILLLGKLTGKGRIFQNDAPLSVLRGFTRHELAELKYLSGLRTMEIIHVRPWRWILRWYKHPGLTS